MIESDYLTVRDIQIADVVDQNNGKGNVDSLSDANHVMRSGMHAPYKCYRYRHKTTRLQMGVDAPLILERDDE
jgi:hypothetical protein